MRTNLPPKKEFSKLVKKGMQKAKKNKVHIGRTPLFFQRSHKGTLYMRKEVKTFLKQFLTYAPFFQKGWEIEVFLRIWYSNKYYKKSVPKITVEMLKKLLTEPKYKKYCKFVKPRSGIFRNKNRIDPLFGSGPSYDSVGK